MIIDFHTHIFPDKIARKTIDLLAEKAGNKPFSDGTVDGLLSEMKKGGVDIAVTLPVITNPAQFDSVNRFAAGVNEIFKNEKRRLISFAGIHPLCEDIDGKMKFIKESGFLGVKIHPDYQGAFISDPGYERILECAKDLDLTVVTHAGVDAGYRDMPVRCPPSLARDVIRKVKHKKFVLAHFGANEMFDEVFDILCDEDVYFDTAYVLRYIDEQTFKKILNKHGADRILFAPDSPWSSMEEDVEVIKSFALEKEVEEKLFSLNARGLLNL